MHFLEIPDDLLFEFFGDVIDDTMKTRLDRWRKPTPVDLVQLRVPAQICRETALLMSDQGFWRQCFERHFALPQAVHSSTTGNGIVDWRMQLYANCKFNSQQLSKEFYTMFQRVLNDDMNSIYDPDADNSEFHFSQLKSAAHANFYGVTPMQWLYFLGKRDYLTRIYNRLCQTVENKLYLSFLCYQDNLVEEVIQDKRVSMVADNLLLERQPPSRSDVLWKLFLDAVQCEYVVIHAIIDYICQAQELAEFITNAYQMMQHLVAQSHAIQSTAGVRYYRLARILLERIHHSGSPILSALSDLQWQMLPHQRQLILCIDLAYSNESQLRQYADPIDAAFLPVEPDFGLDLAGYEQAKRKRLVATQLYKYCFQADSVENFEQEVATADFPIEEFPDLLAVGQELLPLLRENVPADFIEHHFRTGPNPQGTGG